MHVVVSAQDEFLVVDESQLLVPPVPVAPAPRAASPAPPPGVLTVAQLQQLAAALQQAASGGFIALADAVDLMMKMANQGKLPQGGLADTPRILLSCD